MLTTEVCVVIHIFVFDLKRILLAHMMDKHCETVIKCVWLIDLVRNTTVLCYIKASSGKRVFHSVWCMTDFP